MGEKTPVHVDIMALNSKVTGSCNLVAVKLPDRSITRFVLDCGLFQEKDCDEYNSDLSFNPENIDFCFVTHNHVDHTGRLPLMIRKGYNNKIYASETTCKLLPCALIDSLKVLRENAKKKHEKCLYDEADIYKTEALLIPCKHNETFNINDNIRTTLFINGHLNGAALILIQISYPGYEDINLLFTGDYNNKNVFFDVPELPQWVLDLPLTIICESTYGNMDSFEITECFEKNILKCLKNNGTVVAPVFSLGRSQEILYRLKCMQDRGVLDTEIPIYLDGNLAIRYTFLIANNPEVKPEARNFFPQNLTFVNKDNRESLLDENASSGRKIILTTSGMGTHGPAQLYIPRYLTEKNALIHFTGYTAEGTLGDKLRKTAHNDFLEVNGSSVKKVADVEYTSEFSSHAKADEIIDFLKKFNNIRCILLNHGEIDTKADFAQRICKELSLNQKVKILGREYFFRISPYGFVKQISTKFKMKY